MFIFSIYKKRNMLNSNLEDHLNKKKKRNQRRLLSIEKYLQNTNLKLKYYLSLWKEPNNKFHPNKIILVNKNIYDLQN